MELKNNLQTRVINKLLNPKKPGKGHHIHPDTDHVSDPIHPFWLGTKPIFGVKSQGRIKTPGYLVLKVIFIL